MNKIPRNKLNLKGISYPLQYSVFLGFPSGSDGKESACKAGDLDLIPGLEGPLKEGMATHSSILAWRIPWTQKPGELQSMGCKESDRTE